MMISPTRLLALSENKPRWLPWAFTVVSFLGFLDAGYLTASHYFGLELVCTIIQGCEKVTTSAYSQIFGVPVALLGALYYLTFFLLSVTYLDGRNPKYLWFVACLSIVGLLTSAWLVFVQLVLLHAICLYCLFSALTSTTLFIFGLVTFRAGRPARA